MKKAVFVLPVVLACLLLLSQSGAWSHEGGHDLTTQQAIERAVRAVHRIVDEQQLVGRQKLDATWKRATGAAVCKENSEHYLIAFNNVETNQILYVLLTISGTYMRSNFDGHFLDLTISPHPLQGCL